MRFWAVYVINFQCVKKKGLLQTHDGHVLKPLQSPPRGERELGFFNRIFSENENDLNEDERELRSLLPTFRGLFTHNESNFS